MKKAAPNLSQEFKVYVPSKRLPSNEQKRMLAKQLHDFLHIYRKDTEQIRIELHNSLDIERKRHKAKAIDEKAFQTLLYKCCEAELEEIMSAYMKHFQDSSVFLGSTKLTSTYSNPVNQYSASPSMNTNNNNNSKNDAEIEFNLNKNSSFHNSYSFSNQSNFDRQYNNDSSLNNRSNSNIDFSIYKHNLNAPNKQQTLTKTTNTNNEKLAKTRKPSSRTKRKEKDHSSKSKTNNEHKTSKFKKYSGDELSNELSCDSIFSNSSYSSSESVQSGEAASRASSCSRSRSRSRSNLSINKLNKLKHRSLERNAEVSGSGENSLIIHLPITQSNPKIRRNKSTSSKLAHVDNKLTKSAIVSSTKMLSTKTDSEKSRRVSRESMRSSQTPTNLLNNNSNYESIMTNIYLNSKHRNGKIKSAITRPSTVAVTSKYNAKNGNFELVHFSLILIFFF